MNKFLGLRYKIPDPFETGLIIDNNYLLTIFLFLTSLLFAFI